MKNVVFIPQLQSHVYSAKLLEKSLVERGVKVSYLNTADIYGYSFTEGLKIETPKLFRKKIFNYRGIERNVRELITFFYHRKKILHSLDKVSTIVIFSEPTLVRNIVYKARILDIKVHLIMEGMRSENKVEFKYWIDLKFNEILAQIKLRIIHILAKNFQSTPYYPFLPGLNGSSMVDFIYPIGEYSKRVLKNIVSNRTSIKTYGIPKYTNHKFHQDSKKSNGGNNILYITSAFKWHNKYALAKNQLLDIEIILNELINIEGLKLYIKLHPKEVVDDYMHLYKYSSFAGFSEEASLQDIASKYHRIYGNISTMIAELLLYGANVRPLLLSFNKVLFSNSFVYYKDKQFVIKSAPEFVLSLSDSYNYYCHKDAYIYNNPSGYNNLINNIILN